MLDMRPVRRLHGGTRSASAGRVKAVSREAGALAPALTRPEDADTIKTSKSRLTDKTVAHTYGIHTCCGAWMILKASSMVARRLQPSAMVFGPGGL